MPGRKAKSGSARQRPRSISAAEARRRAIRHVVRRMFGRAKVADGKRAGLTVYDIPTQDAWVVFKNWRGEPMLRPSEIVVVCKRTRRVLYEGPANDEG